MLYMGIGLITAVAAILAIVVIPYVISDKSPSATPENAVPAISVIVIVHLLIVVALIWIIKVNKRSGEVKNKELLVIAGVALIVLSLLMLDGAFAYIDNPNMIVTGISMFICVGCDFIAGLLTLIARYFWKRKPLLK
jgi:peptidoglycan/LPS O-acetylase OafA/YrhL